MRAVSRCGCVLLVTAALLPSAAIAHPTGLSYLDLQVQGAIVQATLDLPQVDLAVPLDLDANRDGRLDDADIAARQTPLTEWLGSSLRILADGVACQAAPGKSELHPPNLLTIRATFRCPAPPRDLYVAARFSEAIGDGFATFVHVQAGAVTRQSMVNSVSPSASFSLAASGSAWTAANIARFLGLGMEHIFTGYDHILFLIALLMLGGRLTRIIGIATAFTAAHTITLSLATLGIARLPSRFVESAIAASIAYVAVENWWCAPRPPGREPLVLRWRWMITFFFGLVHGFGFASALGELGLSRTELPVALASFNVGVELGQVVIIALAYPFLKYAGQTSWYRPTGIRYVSTGVFVIALYWFVSRAAG